MLHLMVDIPAGRGLSCIDPLYRIADMHHNKITCLQVFMLEHEKIHLSADASALTAGIKAIDLDDLHGDGKAH